MTNGIVQLKKDRDKSIRAYHPWIFSGAVQVVLHAPQTGDIVDVIDASGKFLGRGFYNNSSSIVVRVHTFEDIPLDEEYFRHRIHAAVEYRKKLGINSNSMRVVNGSGDFIPGLIIDKYGDTLAIQFNSAGLYMRKDIIVKYLVEEFNPSCVYDRTDEKTRAEENINATDQLLYGSENSESLTVMEGDMSFPISVVHGQKTGFYLDLRSVRNRIRTMAKNKSILNLFCYTGSISLTALSAGASSVASVDSSQSVLDMLNAEIEKRGFTEKHRSTCDNAFEFVRKEQELFDIIIVDPPPLCKKKMHVDKSSRAYKDVNMHAFKIAKTGGFVITLCCSHHISMDLFKKIIFAAAKDTCKNVRIAETIGQEPDHPVNVYHPESEYFKGLLLYIE
ncbi:MAG: class I SAM-dependent rRNA methyltransferase [Candidatus Auribacter fodinae]|jgi:23S rRNA (cytosine1962-C5)-methyltransferase|uniref:Class I SAM-dependent rRNA methyltransferase n=1 Tax=Candidatus Auribacter fodinae TaxID=2093366 RepID=A0A3A4R794_9BACT|nr:MAG: class I SAM-dependent rRNA methyltransferase [Candidatus Auribacter fodinae]